MSIFKTLQAAISTVNGTLTKLKEELVKTNSSIVAINSKIYNLENMPISLDDWGLYLRKAIQKQADSHLPFVAENLLQTKTHNTTVAQNTLAWSAFEDQGKDLLFGLGLFPESGSCLRAMCFFFPDVIHEKMMAHFKGKIGVKWGNNEFPSVDERKKMVSDLIQQRDALLLTRTDLEAQIAEITVSLGSDQG